MPVLVELWVEQLPTALGPGSIDQSALGSLNGASISLAAEHYV